MARRRSKRVRRVRLRGAERVLFIIGAILYIFGLLAGLGLLPLLTTLSFAALAWGGGLLLLTLFILIL